MPVDLPSGWTVGELQDLAAINPDEWDPRAGGRIAYIDIASVERTGMLNEPRMIDAENAPSRARRRARVGDVLVSTVRPYLRAFAKVRQAPDNLVASTGFAVVRAFDPADAEYVYQAILTARFLRHLEPRMTGTGYPAVRADDVADYGLAIPPAEERVRIGVVLDSIDAVIEKTEAVIYQSEQLSASLLRQMLTRGMPGRHAEWKHVAGVGTVPACWDVTTLGECGRWLSGGTPSKGIAANWQGTVPWFSPKDMKTRLLINATDHITDAAAREGSRIVPASTVFVVVRGMILAHSFPVAIAGVECAFNQDMKALSCDSTYDPRFLLAVLEHRAHALSSLATPSTHGTMRIISEELFSVRVPHPDLQEQMEIADAVEKVIARTSNERATLVTLRRLKASTADALLSGRVRVVAKEVAV